MTGYIGRFGINLIIFFPLLFAVVSKSLCLVEGNAKHITLKLCS